MKGHTNNPRGRPPKPPGEALTIHRQIKLKPSELPEWKKFTDRIQEIRNEAK